MVKVQCITSVLALGLVFAPPPALADEPFHPGPLERVSVEQTGQSEHGDEYSARLCRDFLLTQAQVRRFFEGARVVEAKVYTDSRYSPCYATGSVEFAGGSRGTWQIHSGKAGVLTLDDGAAFILYCPSCRWKDPFRGGYSIR